VSTKNENWLERMMNSAIKKLISYDPEATKRLKKLAGKKVRVEVQPTQLSFVMTISADTLEVNSDKQADVDTTISGKPSALFAMSTNQHIPGLDGVQIQGDATTGQFIADFLKQLKPDWEDAWCDLLGEGPGYQVSQLMEKLKNTGQSLAESLRRNSREYLLEENRELISVEEMEHFFDEVDDLRADLIRVERKINQHKKTT